MAEPLRVLSIDGGGIRGLVPALLLEELGTGHQNRAYSYYETRNWGPINWINPARGAPIISILMHGQCGAAEHQLELPLNCGPQTNYYRFDAQLDGVNDEMDDASEGEPGGAGALRQAADRGRERQAGRDCRAAVTGSLARAYRTATMLRL